MRSNTVELAQKSDLGGDHRRKHSLGGEKQQIHQTQIQHAKSLHFSAKKLLQLLAEEKHTKKSGAKIRLAHATWLSRSNVQSLVNTKWAPFA